ncbi:MAG: universal stress protein [Chlorobi bacterium]|nr:universal stress protein [Chlorobiota bacterium]
METDKSVILVPWDFSESSEYSMLHAVQLAKVVNNDLMLVHFKAGGGLFGNKAKIIIEKEELENKLLTKAEDINDVYNIRPLTLVKEGSINKAVKEITEQYDINLIVMGQNYVVNKTKTSAKEFLKILENVNVPVIINNSPPSHTHYTEIVVPVDHDKKFKESIHWIIYLSKYYKCNINIIKPHITDDLKKKYLSNNIFFTKKMLDAKNIVYGIKTAKNKDNFKLEIFNFAKIIDADLILVMSDKYNQYMSDKKHTVDNFIPVMVINPRADLRRYQSFA